MCLIGLVTGLVECSNRGPALQEVLGGRTQKRLDRIFLKCIFLKPLDLSLVPRAVLATGQPKKLTYIQLGLGCVPGPLNGSVSNSINNMNAFKHYFRSACKHLRLKKVSEIDLHSLPKNKDRKG